MEDLYHDALVQEVLTKSDNEDKGTIERKSFLKVLQN